MKSKLSAKLALRIGLLIAVTTSLLIFQNCAGIRGFNASSDVLSPDRLIVSSDTMDFSQISAASWDTYPDSFSGTDGLNRAIRPPESPAFKSDKVVAMFYFLWHIPEMKGPYDIQKIIAQDPGARLNANSPLWGPPLEHHYFAEPL